MRRASAFSRVIDAHRLRPLLSLLLVCVLGGGAVLGTLMITTGNVPFLGCNTPTGRAAPTVPGASRAEGRLVTATAGPGSGSVCPAADARGNAYRQTGTVVAGPRGVGGPRGSPLG